MSSPSLRRYGIVHRSLSHAAARRRTPILLARFSTEETKAKTPSKEPPPPPSAPKRTSRVALHPAPIKPAPARPVPTGPAETTPAKPPAPASVQATVAQSEAAEIKPGGVTNIFSLWMEDMNDALRRGILVPAPSDAGVAKKLFHYTKQFGLFYWRGTKLIYANWKTARGLRRRVRAGGEALSRSEARFVAQARRDVLKLLPFLPIALVFEEIIPVLVLYVPAMLPAPFLLPLQRERIFRARGAKQASAAAAMADELRALCAAEPVALSRLRDSKQLRALAGMLSVPPWIPWLRARLVERHLRRVAEDDARLRAESMGARLTEDEVKEALQERGILTTGLDASTAQARLTWWLREVGEGQDGLIGRMVRLVARSGLSQF